MPLAADRLHKVLDDIQAHIPEAIGGEVDISEHLRLRGAARVVLSATLEPPRVEVRLITGNKPSADKPRVLTEWGTLLTEPRATDLQVAPGMRVQSIQVYELADEEAAARHVTGGIQRIEGDAPAHTLNEPTFAETAVASVVADRMSLPGAQPAQAA